MLTGPEEHSPQADRHLHCPAKLFSARCEFTEITISSSTVLSCKGFTLLSSWTSVLDLATSSALESCPDCTQGSNSAPRGLRRTNIDYYQVFLANNTDYTSCQQTSPQEVLCDSSLLLFCPFPTPSAHLGPCRAEQYPGTAPILHCNLQISRAIAEGFHCGKEVWAHPSQVWAWHILMKHMTKWGAGSALMPWQTQLRAPEDIIRVKEAKTTTVCKRQK